ncbi:hypothetical protein [Aquabacterium sp.]|uniref:hypothetical protein n=1 Tax=Aquabacterium sp. TaxID=1872578 RepID=UPI00378331C3
MSFAHLQRLTVWLDDTIRHWDFRQRRTAGGRLDTLCGIDRHTPAALLLPAAVCALLVLASPTPARIALALLAAALAIAVLVPWLRYSARRCLPLRYDVVAQGVLVLAVALASWIGRPDEYQASTPYRHLLVPVSAALALTLLLAGWLADWVFRHLRAQSQYGSYLQNTELFASRGPEPAVTLGTLLTALLTVPLRAPMALLTLPALTALVTPPAWMPLATAIVFALCLAGLFVAGLNERFGMMWALTQDALFTGGAFFVSLLVIVLAALRIAGVSYATTVLDTAAWWTLGVVLAGAYVLSWWYDYWTHRLLADQVLQLINPAAQGAAGIPYTILPSKVRTSVPAAGRRLQVHGSARLVAVNLTGATPYFQAHGLAALVDKLANSGAPGGKATPTPVQVNGRISNFHVLLVLLLGALLGGGAWWLHQGEQAPEARLNRDGGTGLQLQTLLAAAPAANAPASAPAADAPLIVVAASGGGTRAAIYTAALLEGLHQLGASRQVVLGSGVSGGGAALAYFAGYRPALVNGDRQAWQRYLDTMAEPFIQDVMARASEWRMVERGRLGMLLAESFERRWQLPAERSRLTQIQDMGLILNTALAGHFRLPDDAPQGQPLQQLEPRYRARHTSSALAGGRLLLTNLALPPALVGQPLEPHVEQPLPIILRSPALRLEQAAALNANFPPVFSNAAIDVDERDRYWVTDGGAVDNRGMEMLLYALRLVLDSWPAGTPLPRLQVVVADASALSDGYSQDRGISSMAGAGSHYASHLNAELVAAIRQRYAATPGRFQFAYVMMPDLLRESGSFGTHWMLQGTIRVRHGEDSRSISGPQAVQVIRALHTPGAEQGLDGAACTVLQWARADAGHSTGWAAVRAALGGHDTPLGCTPG